jgi:hypothetical protein
VRLRFEPGAQILGLFRDCLVRKRLHVPEESWLQNQGYLKLRIKTGLLTLIFGLSVGDKVETHGDSQVQKAMALFPDLRSLPKRPTPDAETLDSPQSSISEEASD